MTSKNKIIVVALLTTFAASSDAFVNSNPYKEDPDWTKHTNFYDSKPKYSSTTRLYSTGGGGNILDRLVRVTKANLNKFISKYENPEKVIEQAVSDMQTDLVRIRQAYAESRASQRRLQRQKDDVSSQADSWYNRANLALERGNESLAREALTRRQAFADKANTLQLQLDTQSSAADKLYNAMMELEQKIQEASSKKEQLIARARTAKSTQAVNDMLSGLTGTTSMDAFHRMEEKVEALESAAEISGELSSYVDSEFRLLEQSSAVDDELAKMKADLHLLNPGGATPEKMKDRIPATAEKEETMMYIH